MIVTVVGGGGTVGATAAYTLAVDRPAVDVRLCDLDADAAWGHATDVRHARCHAGTPVGVSDPPTGDVSAVEPGPEAVRDADCVVVTASVPRPEGGAERGGREAFWPANRDVADEVADWLRATDPCPVVVVSNPVDRMVWRLYDRSGWQRDRFLGYSLSETARVADELARQVDADPVDVDCPVLGEHGERLVPAFSRATVAGETVDVGREAREAVRQYARAVPYDVIQRRGQRDSSRWVTGRGVALVVEALLSGGTEEPVCLSTPPAGAYGIEGVAVGVPVLLSGDGVERVVEWELADEERAALTEAARKIDAAT
jgi:malate dehydrogenase